MKYKGINKGWENLAKSCLSNAVKEGDFDCVRNEIFSVICGLADTEENDVIVKIIHSKDMIALYGKRWYRRSKK